MSSLRIRYGDRRSQSGSLRESSAVYGDEGNADRYHSHVGRQRGYPGTPTGHDGSARRVFGSRPLGLPHAGSSHRSSVGSDATSGSSSRPWRKGNDGERFGTRGESRHKRYNNGSSSSSASSTSSASSSSSSSSSLASVERGRGRSGSHSQHQRTSVPSQVRWVPDHGDQDSNADAGDRYAARARGPWPLPQQPRDGRMGERRMTAHPADVADGGGYCAPAPHWSVDVPPTATMSDGHSGSGKLQRVFTPPPSPGGGIVNLRPSPLLVAVVRSVAFYRNVPCPSEIYPEVVLAFDEYLARGITLKKFIPNGPPHDRFFAIRFLDLQHRRANSGSSTRGTIGSRAMPEAVFCWYRTSKSTNMRRFFPLADLHSVRRGGEGHPYIEKRKMKVTGGARGGGAAATTATAAAVAARWQGEEGDEEHAIATYGHNGNTEDNYMLLRNGKEGIFSKYINDAYVLQLSFRSLLANSEETVAVQAPNPTILLALHVVGDYFSRIGCDL